MQKRPRTKCGRTARRGSKPRSELFAPEKVLPRWRTIQWIYNTQSPPRFAVAFRDSKKALRRSITKTESGCGTSRFCPPNRGTSETPRIARQEEIRSNPRADHFRKARDARVERAQCHLEHRRQELEKLKQALREELSDDFEDHNAADVLKDQISHMRRELKDLQDRSKLVGRAVVDRYWQLVDPAEAASVANQLEDNLAQTCTTYPANMSLLPEFDKCCGVPQE